MVVCVNVLFSAFSKISRIFIFYVFEHMATLWEIFLKTDSALVSECADDCTLNISFEVVITLSLSSRFKNTKYYLNSKITVFCSLEDVVKQFQYYLS